MFWLWTHRLRLADQELVKLLQQWRLPDDLPAHVGLPCQLVWVPCHKTTNLSEPHQNHTTSKSIHWLNQTRLTSWEASEPPASHHQSPPPGSPWSTSPWDNEESLWHGCSRRVNGNFRIHSRVLLAISNDPSAYVGLEEQGMIKTKIIIQQIMLIIILGARELALSRKP